MGEEVGSGWLDDRPPQPHSYSALGEIRSPFWIPNPQLGLLLFEKIEWPYKGTGSGIRGSPYLGEGLLGN